MSKPDQISREDLSNLVARGQAMIQEELDRKLAGTRDLEFETHRLQGMRDEFEAFFNRELPNGIRNQVDLRQFCGFIGVRERSLHRPFGLDSGINRQFVKNLFGKLRKKVEETWDLPAISSKPGEAKPMEIESADGHLSRNVAMEIAKTLSPMAATSITMKNWGRFHRELIRIQQQEPDLLVRTGLERHVGPGKQIPSWHDFVLYLRGMVMANERPAVENVRLMPERDEPRPTEYKLERIKTEPPALERTWPELKARTDERVPFRPATEAYVAGELTLAVENVQFYMRSHRGTGPSIRRQAMAEFADEGLMVVAEYFERLAIDTLTELEDLQALIERMEAGPLEKLMKVMTPMGTRLKLDSEWRKFYERVGSEIVTRQSVEG